MDADRLQQNRLRWQTTAEVMLSEQPVYLIYQGRGGVVGSAQ